MRTGFCLYAEGRMSPADGSNPLGRLGITKDRRAISLVADGLTFVVGIGHTRYSTAMAPLPEHIHPDCLEMHYCLNGAIEFEIDGGKQTIRPGEVCITQPNMRHHLVSNAKGHQHYWLLLKMPSAKESAETFGLPPPEALQLHRRLVAIRRMVFPVDDRMKTLFREVFETLNTMPRGAYRTLLLRTILLRILVLLTQESQKTASSHATASSIDRIVEDIRLHPERRRTVAEMARASGRCESLFNADFKKSTGFPPAAFISNCRIKKSKHLLETTGMAISKIANSLGYSSTAHFSSQFRLFCGMTPHQWRLGCASRRLTQHDTGKAT